MELVTKMHPPLTLKVTVPLGFDDSVEDSLSEEWESPTLVQMPVPSVPAASRTMSSEHRPLSTEQIEMSNQGWKDRRTGGTSARDSGSREQGGARPRQYEPVTRRWRWDVSPHRECPSSSIRPLYPRDSRPRFK